MQGTTASYAGFWRRLAACLIDGVILILIVVVISVVTALGRSSAESMTANLIISLSCWIGVWVYYALLHSSKWQATPGKLALGVKVTSTGGERIGFGRATGRYFASILSGLILYIGYLMAGFTERKQALHDIIAGTLVVSRNTTPADVQAGLGPPQVSGGVIAVALLASVVPVTGIIAAIAIPAYQDYVIRSQVAEGLNLASAYKAKVAEALAAGADYTTIDNDAIGLPSQANGQYISSIDVGEAAIQIVYGSTANARIRDQSLTLVPGLNEAGDVVWTCGYASVPDGVTAYLEDHIEYTSVDPKYLPSACRG
jgi:uncharacterized RDD family membrane protein YckC/Tfp pilus assembly major pilin PilA